MEPLDLLRRAWLFVARDGTGARRGAQAFEARDARRLIGALGRPARPRAAVLLFAAARAAASARLPATTTDPLVELRAALDAGDLATAVRAGEKAVVADPKSSEAQDLLGRAYGLTARDSLLLEQMHLARKARACFAKAVELDPGNVAALSDLARYDMQAPALLGGGKKKAREVVDRVLALDPARGHVLLGELAERDKKWPEAEIEYRRAIAAAPGQARGRLALSDLLVRRKGYADARKIWTEAREADPSDTTADYELAGIALASGEDLPAAARDLEQA
ncbi:MAG TPA: tetratricopeptide repeat protein, partial [Thermoanaerobaculia bacterium]